MVLSKSIALTDDEIGRNALPYASSRCDSEHGNFLTRLRTGDAAAFDQLVDRYSRDVYALLLRLTGDHEEASDLTQDTFLRAYRSIAGFRGEAELKTWLFRIAVNESRNRFRWWTRRRRRDTISIDAKIGDTDMTVSDTLIDRSISPEEEALRREREYMIGAALIEVSVKYREAVVLCDIEGLSYEETADALGVSIGTVKSRISRGRDELRKRLKDF